jgi:two-component system, OmpR family, phosphate regulon sensor histidine kinase PhoR
MGTRPALRMASGAAVAATGAGFALWLGASFTAMLVAMLSAAVAVLLMRRKGAPRPTQQPIEEVIDPMPEAAAVMEGLRDPVLLVRHRRILYANAAARALLGDHVQGIDVRLAIRHPAAAERLIGAESGERLTTTDLVGLGERERRWVMETAVLEDGGRLVRLTDRSEQHASEQMRVDFVANASHELRTPLATILGFLETLQDESADKATRQRFVKIMFGEAKRIHRLVDDLISLSRIEAERFSTPREEVDLLAIVEEVRAATTQLMPPGGELRVEGAEIGPRVPGDRSQLAQMLQNLVVNALKYGRAGTPVTIRFRDAGAGMLRMSVIDQGEGIAPEHLPRLTERFYRVDPGRSRALGGTGLGLAIVKHIVGRHRGRLEISSELGKGTAMHVLLPRAVPESSKSHTSVTEALGDSGDTGAAD